MDLLCHRDILIDEHSCIGVIEIPVVGTLRVVHTIRLGDVTKDVASNLAEFEHVLHAPFLDVPVGVIQGFPSPSNRDTFTNGNLSDCWHRSDDDQVCSVRLSTFRRRRHGCQWTSCARGIAMVQHRGFG